ncbi:hypothetical protein BC936DRAFT_147695 [Jimgerdemannia flammicorona]|uniref:Protein kinase domain-containing protein n=1 Tax=Jimgerdemannia flammicorona TaxID=994334 RepID=A0A433D4Q5_9FUNG|nr:hypothetical protein BC936DRAFT_147695 [Jimgerdemannia flammicorona]
MLTDDFKRLIWKARTNDGHTIIVKFTRRYNHNAYILCANQRLASELHFYDNQDIYRFRMIIMDYVDGMPLLSSLVTKASLSIRNKIFQDIQNLSNILMVNNCRMLIDFEWCGKDNNARYLFLISQTMLWSNGVEPGAIMYRVKVAEKLTILMVSL